MSFNGNTPTLADIQKAWPQVLEETKKRRRTTHAFLSEARPVLLEGDELLLGFRPEYGFHAEKVLEEPGKGFIEEAIADATGAHLNIDVVVEEGIQELRDRRTASGTPETQSGGATAAPSKGAVFVVHGRNQVWVERVPRLLEGLGLKCTVLGDEANRGQTLIEKLEDRVAQCSYAVVLLTGDDYGGLAGGSGEAPRPRPRQNVILELGYLMAHLGRKHVAILAEQGIDIPSDIDGYAYIPMDEYSGWKYRLAKELREAGFDVDTNHI